MLLLTLRGRLRILAQLSAARLPIVPPSAAAKHAMTMAQVRHESQRAAAASSEGACIAHALTASHARLDCVCWPDASRGLCSPLLCEHATVVALPLRAVSCPAALSDAVACCPRHAAAVLQESPPVATSEIGNFSRRARLPSPAVKASQLSQGRAVHCVKRLGSAAQQVQRWTSRARNASARGVDAHSLLPASCALTALLL